MTNLTSGVLTKTLGSRLVKLDLGSNTLLSLSSIDFKYMTKLETLHFYNNFQIGKDFASSWIFPSQYLPSLKTLNLKGCNIKNVSANTFENLK